MADVLPAIRTSASHTSFFDASATYGGPRRNSYSHSDLRSPSLSSSQASSISSTRSTPASSLSLDHDRDSDSEEDDDNDEGLSFPSYRAADRRFQCRPSVDSDDNDCVSPTTVRPPSSPTPSPIDGPAPETPLSTPDPPPVSEDDSAVRLEPKHHVDYLSYEWKEEDIWSSWRHIVEHRRLYGERSRLENASWRTWAKSQFKLKTVSPETLNWLKDVDVTWLYGPLQPASNRLSVFQQNSEPVSRLSKTNSFLSLNKKPILKKRTMSEVMLQKSLSSSSLVQQAAASVQAQQTAVSLERRRPRPIIGRVTSDFVSSSIPSRTTSREPTDYFSSHSTSGLQTPDISEKKHIRFDDKVEQCIAVECKDADDDDEDDCNHNPWAKYRDEDSSSDEGVVMMKRQRKRRPLSRTNSKSSFNGESKIIAKLPSTTLKYRTDSPDVTEQHQSHSLGFWRSSRLSPSPSQETLRPSNPSTNFLLPSDDDDDDEEDDDLTFNPSRAYEVKRTSTPTPSDPYSERPGTPTAASSSSSEGSGLRRTASGMFMPFEDREDDASQPGILGKVVDTVNTARDIAHVIWNVGWRN